MRKWKQGLITVVAFFIAIGFLASGNPALEIVGFLAVFFSMFYSVALVIAFMYQQVHRWTKRNLSRLSVEEKLVKTKIMTIY